MRRAKCGCTNWEVKELLPIPGSAPYNLMMPKPHTVTLTPYGPLRAVLGDAPISVSTSAATVSELLQTLHADFPALAAWRGRIACALDDSLVSPDTAIPRGACLDLIPPVSGG